MYLLSFDATLNAIPNTIRLKNHTGSHSITIQKPIITIEPKKITFAVGLPIIANKAKKHTVRKPAINREAANSGMLRKSATKPGKLEISIGVFFNPPTS